MKEFFVGYLPTIPPGIARTVHRAVLGLLCIAAFLAVALVASQHRFPAAFFEFTQERDFEGVIEARPYPALLVTRPGVTAPQASYSRYLLVALGKHGADDQVAGLAAKRVKLRGKLIYRGDETLVEIMPNSIAVVADDAAMLPKTDLEPAVLTGEIVDTKCYFGVMNPGEGKVHRDCAARCLSGGIPPALIVREADGRSTVYVLANADGGPVPSNWAARRTARAVTIRGRIVKSGDTLTLEADLDRFQFAANGRPSRLLR